MTQGRQNRVGELIRKEIAEMIQRGIKDPRIAFVSVMDVKMSTDLRYADVYVSLYGTEKEKKSSLIGLKSSAGWIRRQLGKILRLRYVPEVRFFADETLDRVFHLEEVFKSLHTAESEKTEGEKENDQHTD